jgi:hypothetical protein
MKVQESSVPPSPSSAEGKSLLATRESRPQRLEEIVAANARLTFGLVDTPSTRAEVYDLRLLFYKEKFPYLLGGTNAHPAEDTLDKDSLTFYCRDGDTVVGTCRITPQIANQWEISPSMPTQISLPTEADTVQLNRVYVLQTHSHICVHEFMFYHFAELLLRYTSFRRYFATCNAALVRLYKRIGARLAHPEAFHLNNRGSHNYYLVAGTILAFREAVERRYHIQSKPIL